MTVVKQLIEFIVYPLAMSAGVALCLWLLLGQLRIERMTAAGHGITLETSTPPPNPEKPPADVARQDAPAMPERPVTAVVSEPTTAVVAEQTTAATTEDVPLAPVEQPARPSGRIAAAIEDLPLGAGDSGPLVTQLQGALVRKGYSVGPAGADGNLNDETLAALQAFQDNDALPVQPSCDQECWTALGPPRPE